MPDNNEDIQPEETRKNDDEKYRSLLISRLRLNKDYKDIEFDKEDTLTLEALYRAEEIRVNKETKETLSPDNAFFTLNPISHIKKNEQKALEKKQNTKTLDPRFNIFEIFHSQYQHPDKMCKFNDQCEILTMRVHPSNKHPEWQVS